MVGTSKKNNKKKNRLELYKKIKQDVIDLEKYLKEYVIDIFSDPVLIDKYKQLLRLKTSDRRLVLTYICLDKSIPKTASFFHIQRVVLIEEITRINKILNFDLNVLY